MNDTKKTKPGPEPERLVIEDDPAEALDRLLGKGSPKVGEWVDYKPGLPPGWYDVRVVEEGQPNTLTVELLDGPSDQRDDGWCLSPFARILRVHRLAGPPR